MLILVIDDDAELRSELGQLLQDAGFEVVLAAHGQQALDMVRRGSCRPDVILLDVQMPVMDGWHFLSARLSEPALVTTPIVLMSGLAENHQRAVGVVSEFLAKPIPLSSLLAAIDRCRQMIAHVDEHAEKLRHAGEEARLVLVVEDDDDTRDTIAEVLEHERFRVKTAKNGREALALLRDHLAQEMLPSVIVCDLRMPVMDGWKFWHELRQDHLLASVPVILMSAHSYELGKLGDEVRSLAKPVELHHLLAAIRSATAG